MKQKILSFSLFLLGCVCIQAQRAEAVSTLTLEQCFELALKQSEELKITQEDINAAEARYKQSLGSILPNIKFNLTDFHQDPDGKPAGTRRQSTESKFHLSQPLFNGFKEFSAMSGYKHQSKSFELQYRRAAENLYRELARAFFTAAKLETGVGNIDVLIELTHERVKELGGRVKLGKSRESELLSAQSQLSNLRSLRALTVGNLAAARELLGFYTGQDLSQTPLAYSFEIKKSTLSLEQALMNGANRLDLKAQREEVEANRYAVRFAKAGYWPSIDFSGNYYTKRRGTLSDVDWDYLFNIDIPLFQGGAAQGRVREAYSNYVKAQLHLQRSARAVDTDVRTAFIQLQAVIEDAETLKDAYLKAKRSYELHVREYRLGLVNNLEVLQAMNTMQQLKQDLDGAVLNTHLSSIELQVAMGAK